MRKLVVLILIALGVLLVTPRSGLGLDAFTEEPRQDREGFAEAGKDAQRQGQGR